MKRLFLLFFLLAACGRTAPPPAATLFTLLPPEATGITFNNRIVEREGFNVLEYEYLYNGGGVAVGDVDGDGLPDLYFTANMGPNALYLNKGNFQFEDITGAAGVGGSVGWSTGVTMADVNGDGLLDLYVCRSGNVSEPRRRNELFINNGDLTFTERAAEYGLDDPSYSTHATFFDYDGDGDLDLFLVNHPIRRYTRFDVMYMRSQRDPLAGDKLYRNDGTHFTDVSEAAGIIGNPIGFGLSAQVSDINQDGWPDLYVANDYVEDDYLYINNGDGTFTEAIRAYLTHTSYSSMGTDIADFNNDGLPDLLTLDMLPEDNRRQKLLKGPDGYDQYALLRGYGYHHQYMRNMLHVNNANGTFSEIGQLAGISNTDWSWAALIADFDNDGYKDLFVTNGYLRDYTDLDFMEFTLKKTYEEAARTGKGTAPHELVQQMPTSQLKNYLFSNERDLTFENRTRDWGLDQFALSNGAAYADLDGDGDLDLVVNNINQEAFVYRNNARETTGNNYLKIRLEGTGGNRFGIGANVALTTAGGQVFYQELVPARGFQSSVEPVLLFGLGDAEQVDLTVTWPDGSRQVLGNVPANQTLTLEQQLAAPGDPAMEKRPLPFFAPQPGQQGLTFTHREDAFVDFEREPLLPHMLSRLGPALARGDVNRDGLDDVFVGGARGQAAALFFQQADGTFNEIPIDAFTAHRDFEDVGALFLDVDGDGDLDLYVVSGGSHADGEAAAYQDRVYLNGGFGSFTYHPEVLPEMHSSGSTVAAHDFDGDGDLDLFVGGRVHAGRYPFAPRSYLLENRGGRFVDITAQASEALLRPGMITDALWQDPDGDGTAALVLVGEWMPIRVFRQAADKTFTEITGQAGFQKTGGWWNCIAARDLDGDGDVDLIVGNRGLNAQMQATEAEPARIHGADFDGNGTVDAVMSYYIQGQSYPVPARDELLEQLPHLARAFPTYASYADAALADLFTPDQLDEALVLETHGFATSIFENLGDGTFRIRPLPVEAQFAPVNSILVEDFDGDGTPDLLLAGNNTAVRAQWGRHNAGQGLLLLNKGQLDFEVLAAARSGFFAPGDVRKLEAVSTRTGRVVVVANNDDEITTFSILPRQPS